MEWSASVPISAPPEVVWAVMAEVEAWPEWTASVRSIVRVDPGPLHVGQRLRISQPRFPTTVWTLTELVERSVFVWVAGGPGARTTARHELEPSGAGTLVTLRLTQQGPLGLLVGALSSKVTKRYLELESTGLKRRSEERAAGVGERG
ncbi:MAG TPA: SRPBCC family protein [Actinophytocola sp.]|uniref:SRPBCC family protein n=1 Tax=Actinophytocola sp. TaxID=1872138 RepID=UPI002DB8E5F6|nr:SRPBCC family protein [Actinophytocola sp.]HEU5472638.1 SRPBCC family protein [Actinophytocola sp.]